MPAYKIIFRLDFGTPNYEILDRPGSVMRMMNEMAEGYWPEFQENPQQRSVTAVSKKTDLVQKMTVEPQSINFLWENGKGVDFSQLERDKHLVILFKGVKTICDNFKISKIARAGIRFYCLNSLGSQNSDLNPVFSEIVAAQLLSGIRDKVGEIDDYGITFDGTSDDRIKYHLNFGPYKDKDFEQQFQHIKRDDLRANLSIDLDLYEENFSLTVSPFVWARSMMVKTKLFSENLEENLMSKVNVL